MLENTPMPYPEHSNDARGCQYPEDSLLVFYDYVTV